MSLILGPDTGDQGRRIGYARVSTSDQKLDMQLDFLARAECHRVFYDHGISGAKASRPGLDAALGEITAGDTLVVFKLDRLGRSVLHLADLLTRLDNMDAHFCSMTEGINTNTSGGKLVFHIFAAVAEFHRDLIRENTINGLHAARQRGSKIGRPPLLDDIDIVNAHRFMRQEGKSVQEAAQQYGVSRHTIQRGLRRLALHDAEFDEWVWPHEGALNDNT